jgi:GTP cyclohydrolase I
MAAARHGMVLRDVSFHSLCMHRLLPFVGVAPTSSRRAVGVEMEAEHTCVTIRGVRAPGAKTVTSALYGTLRRHRWQRCSWAR